MVLGIILARTQDTWKKLKNNATTQAHQQRTITTFFCPITPTHATSHHGLTSALISLDQHQPLKGSCSDTSAVAISLGNIKTLKHFTMVKLILQSFNPAFTFFQVSVDIEEHSYALSSSFLVKEYPELLCLHLIIITLSLYNDVNYCYKIHVQAHTKIVSRK